MSNDVTSLKKFGERLKQLRKERKLTQTELAVALGTTQSTIYKYEKGIQNVPMSVLTKFANYFEVSIDDLAGVEIEASENTEPPWIKVLKMYDLTDDEIKELMNYATFIVSKRN